MLQVCSSTLGNSDCHQKCNGSSGIPLIHQKGLLILILLSCPILIVSSTSKVLLLYEHTYVSNYMSAVLICLRPICAGG